MNQHLMAEVNFMAPGEEEGTGGEYECPDIGLLEMSLHGSIIQHSGHSFCLILRELLMWKLFSLLSLSMFL